MMKFMNLTAATVLLMTPVLGMEQQILVEDFMGSCQELDIHQDTSFADVIKAMDQQLYVADRYREDEHDDTMPALRSMQMNVQVSDQGIYVKAVSKASDKRRDYNQAVTQQNQTDIYFIVKTLADSSLVKIKNQESSLKSAGDRINAIHPLKFLTTIFTNEELKVCMINLEGRSWVWKSFLKGLMDTLIEEHAVNNVMPFADDFASQIGVNKSLFLSSMQGAQWAKFVEVLIHGVPRKGQPNRFDM